MNWKRVLLIVTDIAIAMYLVLAISVFNKPQNKASVCTEVNIYISDNIMKGFLTANDVKQILENEKIYPLERDMQLVDISLELVVLSLLMLSFKLLVLVTHISIYIARMV